MPLKNEEEEKKSSSIKKEVKPKPEVESKLDKRVQELIKLIFDMKMMENVMKELEFRTDSSVQGTKMTAEKFSEKYNIPVPTAEVRKSGFILLTISTDTEIFPANEWERAGDLLIWNYKREDGKTLIWYFIREGADTSVNN